MAKPLKTTDEFDKKILDIIQMDNQVPVREIAEKINLSLPAVAKRLQRLKALGYITHNKSILSPELLGVNNTIIVNVSVENEAVEELDRIRERFLNCPQIQHCYYVTGDIDFVLILAVRDMQEYERLTRELFFDGGNVRRFRTYVAMERVKASQDLLLSHL
ncbi:Lrp/AsnC family transcriptional regulator [Klebsiella sp. NPDC088457]